VARKSRLFLKKRGNRRTGSAAMARVGEAALFSALLTVGTVGLWAVLSWWIVPNWEADFNYVETTGTVVAAELKAPDSNALEGSQYRAAFQVEYKVEGETHRAWNYDAASDYAGDRESAAQIVERFAVGGRYPCWFDPHHPERVVLERGGHWWVWLTLVIPIPFITIGAGGLIYTLLHWRTSNERRAASLRTRSNPAVTQAPEDADAMSDGPAEPAVVFAGLPAAENLTNSPGTHLAYRLPMSSESSWRLFSAMVFCVLAAGVAVVCAWLAVAGHVRGEADWLLDLSILPLAGVTAWAVSLVAKQWTVSNAVGPTMIEIADHPLFPGETCELMVLQSGRLAINWLEVSLICTEQASYQQGTDIRTESATVWRERVLRCERFRVDDDQPFQRKCLMTIPAGAMHSLSCPSNEIRWSIVVRGESDAWPIFERAFPIVVYPPKTQSLVKRQGRDASGGKSEVSERRVAGRVLAASTAAKEEAA
jgi:hypothetical protein